VTREARLKVDQVELGSDGIGRSPCPSLRGYVGARRDATCTYLSSRDQPQKFPVTHNVLSHVSISILLQGRDRNHAY
jgi:hypothetical protein